MNIVTATMAHVLHVADHLRQADIDEIEALGAEPRWALINSFDESLMSWAIMDGDEPVAVFGVCVNSMLSEMAIPWMLATPAIERKPMAFLRVSKKGLRMMQGPYHLMNFVDDRHVQAKAWLAWLGFKIGEPAPAGPKGLPFRRFEMRST